MAVCLRCCWCLSSFLSSEDTGGNCHLIKGNWGSFCDRYRDWTGHQWSVSTSIIMLTWSREATFSRLSPVPRSRLNSYSNVNYVTTLTVLIKFGQITSKLFTWRRHDCDERREELLREPNQQGDRACEDGGGEPRHRGQHQIDLASTGVWAELHQNAHKVSDVVFDKNGTITYRALSVAPVWFSKMILGQGVVGNKEHE